MGRNIHKDWCTWDARAEGLPIMRQSSSTCGGVHRFEYEINEEGTYEEGAQRVQ